MLGKKKSQHVANRIRSNGYEDRWLRRELWWTRLGPSKLRTNFGLMAVKTDDYVEGRTRQDQVPAHNGQTLVLQHPIYPVQFKVGKRDVIYLVKSFYQIPV